MCLSFILFCILIILIFNDVLQHVFESVCFVPYVYMMCTIGENHHLSLFPVNQRKRNRKTRMKLSWKGWRTKPLSQTTMNQHSCRWWQKFRLILYTPAVNCNLVKTEDRRLTFLTGTLNSLFKMYSNLILHCKLLFKCTKCIFDGSIFKYYW